MCTNARYVSCLKGAMALSCFLHRELILWSCVLIVKVPWSPSFLRFVTRLWPLFSLLRYEYIELIWQMHAQWLPNADTLKSQQQIFQGLLLAFSCLILRAYGLCVRLAKCITLTIANTCKQQFPVVRRDFRLKEIIKGVRRTDWRRWRGSVF